MMGMQPMEMRPPCSISHRGEQQLKAACEEKDTHDVVVLAADGGGRAFVTGSNPDDVERRAAETEEEVEALDDDVEQTEDHGRIVISRLW